MTKTVKKTFKINGMDCASCSLVIDSELESIPGVIKSQTSYAKQETEVEFEEDKVTEEKVLETIKKSGYELFLKDLI
jgi:copper chaperone CopZ